MIRRPIYLSLAACAAALVPAAGMAAGDPEVEALRAELTALKSDYAARVEALEARINQLESAPPAVAATPAPAPATVDAAPVAASSRSTSAFNPAISLILAGNYAHRARRLPRAA